MAKSTDITPKTQRTFKIELSEEEAGMLMATLGKQSQDVYRSYGVDEPQRNLMDDLYSQLHRILKTMM